MDFNRCYKCFKPIKACRCADIAPVETGVRFIFLMHPKEAYKQKTGTGRLTSLALADSEIIVGIDFTDNARVNELINDDDAFPVILYPASDAYFTDSPEFRTAIGGKKLTVFVVDATWFFARKMMNLSRNLHGLPKLSFRKEYRSRFEFKKQPSPECLSTIESTYYLAEELKEAGIVKPDADLSCLMTAFRNMVEYQLACEQARHVAMARELYPELFEGQSR